MSLLMTPLFAVLTIILLTVTANAAGSEDDASGDVRFVYVAKWVNHLQRPNGTHSLLDYGYGAQIFAFSDGRINTATLTGPLPGGRRMSMADDGDKYPGRNLRFTGAAQPTLPALNHAFPDGRYELALETASGNFAGHVLSFAQPEHALRLASPPSVSLQQCGHSITGDKLYPGEPLIVGWTPFSGAADDPRGVMNDLVVVKFSGSDGAVIRRSPLPYFGRGPAIHHTVTEHTLPGDLLKADASYRIEVEQINIVDSHVRDGIPEVAAYVTNVRVSMHTQSESCHRSPPRLYY